MTRFSIDPAAVRGRRPGDGPDGGRSAVVDDDGDAPADRREDHLTRHLARPLPRWQVHIAGALDTLPDTTARALKVAVGATRECPTGAHVTLAVGYGVYLTFPLNTPGKVDHRALRPVEEGGAWVVDQQEDYITRADQVRSVLLGK
ncbi:hypothetical protein [Kitasatospora purpeofusca]|uniref:Uncharacterized protein n=1 Tax=Kitasatospora purpeofusca TaxID=67352 RepID=A0ABZ1UBQ0_9ACTN|nr:hypothetical protein [Kitasatospora purpeofusca]